MPECTALVRPRPKQPWHRARFLLMAMVVLVSGCTSHLEGIGYAWQSVSGHLELLRSARPVGEVLADPSTDATEADKLRYALASRVFASEVLMLPDNGSYTRYAKLPRRYVLWNVFAAPELSLELQTWCFPVAGCVSYRGYYNEQHARAFGEQLQARGLDVRVAGIPAYSTLGWFDDPIPSSVIRFPKLAIARLIFHELAHQVAYAPGDTTFNESFATALERLGIERWLAQLDASTDLGDDVRQYRMHQQRRADFLALVRGTRDQLSDLYAGDLDVDEKRRQKAAIFARLREQYEHLKQTQWQGWKGYDAWFKQPLGNAHVAAIGAYHDHVDAFTALFEQGGSDFEVFYDAVRDLAGLSPSERLSRLESLKQAPRRAAVPSR